VRGFEAAVKKAQDRTQLGCGGIAETDPSFDVDGWDATVEVSALATVLTLAPAKPQAQVQVWTIRCAPTTSAAKPSAGWGWSRCRRRA